MSENSNDMTTPQEPVAAPAPAVLPPIAEAPAAAQKDKGVRTYVLAGVSAVVGAVLVLGAGAIGYSIGNHDSENHREASLTVSADRNGDQGGQGAAQGDGPMMGGQDQRGVDPDGDNWTGGNQGGNQGGGQGDGPMMGGQDQRGVDPDGDNWTGGNQGNGPMMGGQDGNQGSGPMMRGNGIQDFLNQLQSGQGLTSDQQQFLDQLKGFVGGMRNQVG